MGAVAGDHSRPFQPLDAFGDGGGERLTRRPSSANENVGQPVEIAFAFANAALFAIYIVLAHRVSRHRSVAGIDGLAAAMPVAFVFVSPVLEPRVEIDRVVILDRGRLVA